MIAQEILNQLGGNRFIVMTGSKNLMAGKNFLTFKVGKNAKKVTNCKVTLNDFDTYDLEFFNVRGVNVKTLYKAENVYCDMLQEVFTENTGLITRL